MATSEELRKRGNVLFRKAQELGLAPVLRQRRLEDALRLYYLALSESADPSEIASCEKNISVAKFQQALDVFRNAKSFSQEQFSCVNFHLERGISSVSKAATLGRDFKEQGWLDGLITDLERNIDIALDLIKELEDSWREKCLQGLCKSFSNNKFRDILKPAARVHLHFGKFIFHRGIRMLETQDSSIEELANLTDNYKYCLNCMRECYSPIVRAKDFAGKDKELLDSIVELEEDVYRYECTCRAVQAFTTGNCLLFQATKGSENIQIDAVWASLDNFKQANIYTRGMDVEVEAIACSRIGKMYSQVLKMPGPAISYYSQALQLGLSLVQAVPHILTANWFTVANNAVIAFQENRRKEEEAEAAKEREPILEMLKEELAELRLEADRSAASLLKFLYKTHPPKDRRHKMGDIGDVAVTKKAIVQAILHYHPDKNQIHGRKWEVLCEEITKHLNRKYEYYK